MTEMRILTIKPRERFALISALRAGVVPSVGLQHIQVGRQRELEAVIKSLGHVAAGGAAMRFVIGEYGSGKTFLLSMTRELALRHNLVVCSAELSPDRLLSGKAGQARMLLAELMQNMMTKSNRDGGALDGVLESFLHPCIETAHRTGAAVQQVVEAQLGDIREMVAGYAFAKILGEYARAYQEGNSHLQDCARRWLRAEYSSPTEAFRDLGVRTILDDRSLYEGMRLMARFVRLAGYGGLIICLDEMANLYKIQHPRPRHQNFEQLLRMYNDVYRGTTEGLGIFLAGTPEFLTHPRRGLFSDVAWQSRLESNLATRVGLADFSGPVIRLSTLTAEEFYHLLERIREVFAGGDRLNLLAPDEALHAFLERCHKALGAQYFQSPRKAVTGFVEMLGLLEQHPTKQWTDIIDIIEIEKDEAAGGAESDDDLPIIEF